MVSYVVAALPGFGSSEGAALLWFPQAADARATRRTARVTPARRSDMRLDRVI
jgi:hypothetical protein